MDLNILYEDEEILVVEKPVGIESQSARSFDPDMVSEVKKHINTLSPKQGEPYVGVIHRLDKPVGGVMVYAKTKGAAESLSRQVSQHQMEKIYYAVVCGKPVENFGAYVDYLWKDGKNNCSKIVDKGIKGAKLAELHYQVVENRNIGNEECSLVKITLKTGRHHQIRVQMAGHGTPLWGDRKYNPNVHRGAASGNVALFAYSLSFSHPVTKKWMNFSVKPKGEIFEMFSLPEMA
ncbi:RluA family pseudouridine synthase [Lacrimispora sp.]|jgi:23S rRNA pseudouridine1911/1915/1917 synthase|uniref:RluA family pseudouridine synthase n=1 Tax=Lacrimispora sp. TaxID=2719234 RepID=UPI00289AE6A5|nr:RluA family pseudouridine synthase [Lacrimispora sp.]